jgi:RNA polymerase-binding transcription factor DksA
MVKAEPKTRKAAVRAPVSPTKKTAKRSGASFDPTKKAVKQSPPKPAKATQSAAPTSAKRAASPAKRAAPAKKAAPVKKAAPKKASARAPGAAPRVARKTAPAKVPATGKPEAPAEAPESANAHKRAVAAATGAKRAEQRQNAEKANGEKAPTPRATEPAVKKAPRKTTVICPLSGFEVKPDRPNLAPRTIERLRTKLLEERARHISQAEELQAEAAQLALDREEGDTQFDEEGGEGDTISVERERDLMLSASAREIVEEIDRALERMRNKTYGLCTPAGRRISVERLEALPYAETCVDCKARAERRR